MILKSVIISSLTAVILGSCYPYQGKYFDQTAQADVVYEDILPEQTNGKDFYTLMCWEIHAESEEKRVRIPTLQMHDPTYTETPFYTLTFQDISGRPCTFAGFTKKEGSVTKDGYIFQFTHVLPRGLVDYLHCDREPLLGDPEHYSIEKFPDSVGNTCSFIFMERR